MIGRLAALVLGSALVAMVAAALAARASAPPVGPLPKGPLTTIRVQHGLLFAIALPRPGKGLTWRGARPDDATIARPLDEGELNGNIVFTYRAGRTGSTTVVYALTRGETQKALEARYFRVLVVGASGEGRARARVRLPRDPSPCAVARPARALRRRHADGPDGVSPHVTFRVLRARELRSFH